MILLVGVDSQGCWDQAVTVLHKAQLLRDQPMLGNSVMLGEGTSPNTTGGLKEGSIAIDSGPFRLSPRLSWPSIALPCQQDLISCWYVSDLIQPKGGLEAGEYR